MFLNKIVIRELKLKIQNYRKIVLLEASESNLKSAKKSGKAFLFHLNS